MSGIENRLREAFRADGETIGPDTVHPWSGCERRSEGRRLARIVVPLTAAAAIAAIAIASVAVPRIWPERSSASKPVPAIAVSPPGYFMVVKLNGKGSQVSRPEVISTATGLIVSTLGPLPDGRIALAVAAFQKPGTFVLEAAKPHACGLWFYQFRLTGTGQPGLARLPVPKISGRPIPGQDRQPFAASSASSIVAVASAPCTQPPHAVNTSRVSVINTAARTVSSWTLQVAQNQWEPANLSVSAYGKAIGLVSPHGLGERGFGSPVRSDAWEVLVSAPAGPLPDHWHHVVGSPSVLALTEVVTPTGNKMIALTGTIGLQTSSEPRPLSVYRIATGQRVRVLRTLSGQLGLPVLSLEQHDAYLLMAGWNVVSAQVPAAEYLNLSTGKLKAIPGDAAIQAVSIAW